MGCRLWGRTELDTTEATWRQQQHTASLVAQTVKNLPATPETWIPSLGWEDPLEKGKAAAAAAAAADKLLQSCLTLRDPVDGSPPGSPVPGILQARTLEWVAISFSNA